MGETCHLWAHCWAGEQHILQHVPGGAVEHIKGNFAVSARRRCRRRGMWRGVFRCVVATPAVRWSVVSTHCVHVAKGSKLKGVVLCFRRHDLGAESRCKAPHPIGQSSANTGLTNMTNTDFARKERRRLDEASEEYHTIIPESDSATPMLKLTTTNVPSPER